MTNEALQTVQNLRSDLEKAMPKLQEVAAKHLKPERVVRILLTACSKNPRLLDCSRESVLTFCMSCAQTGLEPIGAGGAWPVPYRNKNGKTEMQFIPDYRGLVNCAKRAECITDAYAEVVKERDDFSYSLGLTPDLKHVPATGDRGKLIAAYCVFQLPDGTKRFVVMDGDEVKGIQNRSRAGRDGPWITDESEMWKKTVTRRAMKPFAGMSAMLDAAIDADNAATGIEIEKPAVTMPTLKKPIEAHGEEVQEHPAEDSQEPAFAVGDESKTVTVEYVEGLETRLSPGAIAKARKTIGIAKDATLTDMDAEFLTNLAHLYRAAL
jgi:recombination protein RecT